MKPYKCCKNCVHYDQEGRCRMAETRYVAISFPSVTRCGYWSKIKMKK